MKYNLIYFDANQLEDYFFNDDYRDAYDEFLIYENNNNYTYALWTGREKNNKLECLIMEFEGDCVLVSISKEKINKIWVRGKNFDYEKYKDFDVINTQIVESIADDKNKTYEYLKDLMPKSQVAWFDKELESFEELPTRKNFPLILKPLDGLKGNGIIKFENKKEFDEFIDENYEYDSEFILQEFIECVDYEPLGIKGVHDIRLIIVNSEIVGLAVRQPKEGGWLCNVAQGGSIKVYDSTELESLDISDSLYNEFYSSIETFKNDVISKLPEDFKSAVFSIDFCNTKDGFKIFELNSYPGIRLEYKTYIEKVKELLNK